jgi:Ser/Thr protein kinase RdoA (MazF antagonist)
MWRVAYFLSAYEVVCELTKTEPDFRPFEASSLARMAQIGRDYMIQHYEEMFKALWQSEIDEGEEK